MGKRFLEVGAAGSPRTSEGLGEEAEGRRITKVCKPVQLTTVLRSTTRALL